MENYKDWTIECEIVDTGDTVGARAIISRDGERFSFPVMGGFDTVEVACLRASEYARDWIDENY